MDKRDYRDVEPLSEWAEDESTTVVRIDVQGFRKDQLRVQLDSTGVIKVSGERPLTESVGDNRWSRFRKDFQIPRGCSSSGIRARFDDGHLYILMPKLPPPLLPPHPQMAATTNWPQGTASASGATQRAPSHAGAPDGGVAGEKPSWARPDADDDASAGRWEDREEWRYNEGSRFDSGLRRSMKGTATKIMMALLVLAGVGIAMYFHYRVIKEGAAPINRGAGAMTIAD